LELKQALDRRLDEVSLPGRARLHAFVPESSELVPCRSHIVVQVALLAHKPERSSSGPGQKLQERRSVVLCPRLSSCREQRV